MNTVIDTRGYVQLRQKDRRKGIIYEHTVIAEKALGKPLPKGAVVHHFNEIKTDNRPCNLVICPGPGYHSLIHQRMEAKKACGYAHWLKCNYCGQHGDPKDMRIATTGNRACHRICESDYQSKYYKRNKLKKLAYQRKRYAEQKELNHGS